MTRVSDASRVIARIDLPASGEVHVWRGSTDVEDAGAAAVRLSPVERERAGRMAIPLVRARFIGARAFMRAVLASYLGVPAPLVPLAVDGRGKPFLENVTGLHFNLSHTGALAALAVAAAPVGIDIEVVRADVDDEGISARYFSASENAALRSLPAPERRHAFFVCWSRKEAYLKARGVGFGAALSSFSVAVPPALPRITPAVDADGRRWSLEDLQGAGACVGAVAIEGALGAVIDRDWAPIAGPDPQARLP